MGQSRHPWRPRPPVITSQDTTAHPFSRSVVTWNRGGGPRGPTGVSRVSTPADGSGRQDANTDPGLAPATCARPQSRGTPSKPARPEPPRPRAVVGGGGATALHIDAPGTSHPLGLPGRTPVRTALTLAHGSDAGCRSEPWGRLRLRAGSPLPGGPSVLSIKNHLQLMGEAPTPRGMAVSLKVRQVHVTHTRKHRAGRPRPYVAGRRRVAGQADRNPG